MLRDGRRVRGRQGAARAHPGPRLRELDRGLQRRPTPRPHRSRAGPRPSTLYGVYKLANEGTARVFWEDDGVASIGIRPYVVYGPGRDQGLTSGPSLAMAAAARGEPFEIGYGGTVQYDFAPDVGRAFALASPGSDARARDVANFPGEVASTAEVVAAIEAAAPEVSRTDHLGRRAAPVPGVARGDGARAPGRPAARHAARRRRAPHDRALLARDR